MSVIIEDSHQKGVTVFNHGDSGSTGTKTCPEAFSLIFSLWVPLGSGFSPQERSVQQQALLCTGDNAELAALTDFSRHGSGPCGLQAQSRELRW